MGFITYQITIGRDIHKAEHGPCAGVQIPPPPPFTLALATELLVDMHLLNREQNVKAITCIGLNYIFNNNALFRPRDIALVHP